MREIKFRVWDRKKKRFDTCRNGGFVNTGIDYKGVHNVGDQSFKIIQLYLGEIDANGKQMCEGDIFNFGGKIGKIVYEKGSFVFKTKTMSMILRDHNNEDFKIIGNIYENSELVNKKQEIF